MESAVALELLRQIARNTGSNESLWIAAIAAGSALLGAAISGYFAYLAAKRASESQANAAKLQADLEMRKVRASLVSSERLNWLKDLRGKVAEFYANLERQLIYFRRVARGEVDGMTVEAVDSLSHEVRLQSNAIRLVVNSQVDEQRALSESLDNALTFINRCIEAMARSESLPEREELRAIKVRSIEQMELIGRKCWLKVQQLE